MQQRLIKTVVFDLGKVLIDYDYANFIGLLRDQGAQVASVEDFSERVNLAGYEHGQVTCSEFIAGINNLLARPLTETDMIAAWNGIFTPLSDMLEFAARLKRHYPVYLLSNIGKLHWDYLSPTYGLVNFCHDYLLSYEAGAMKPSPIIYREAQLRFSLVPETTLFIDDKPENIAGAQACGWQGIHHQCSQATQMKIREMTGFAG